MVLYRSVDTDPVGLTDCPVHLLLPGKLFALFENQVNIGYPRMCTVFKWCTYLSVLREFSGVV